MRTRAELLVGVENKDIVHIDRDDTIYWWLTILSELQRDIVMDKLSGWSWKRIAYITGLSLHTIRQEFRKAIHQGNAFEELTMLIEDAARR